MIHLQQYLARKQPLILVVILILLTLFVSAPSVCMADDQGVDSGREAIKRSGNYPWYNPESDSTRRVRERKEEDPSSGSSSDGESFAGVVVWTFFIILVIAIIAAIIWAFINREIDPANSTQKEKQGKELEDRIEQLPLEIDPAKHDLLSAAKQEYEQGNFSIAIIYLFSYQLVELDKKQLIRLLKGKTNRQYLIELRSFNNLNTIIATTIRCFEDSFFGKYEITKSQFEECWNQIDQFHQLIGQNKNTTIHRPDKVKNITPQSSQS